MPAGVSVSAGLTRGPVPNCISQTALIYSRNGDTREVNLTLIPEGGGTVPHSGVVTFLLVIQFPVMVGTLDQAPCLLSNTTLSVNTTDSSFSRHATIHCVPLPPAAMNARDVTQCR